jgi:hypothetical protein
MGQEADLKMISIGSTGGSSQRRLNKHDPHGPPTNTTTDVGHDKSAKIFEPSAQDGAGDVSGSTRWTSSRTVDSDEERTSEEEDTSDDDESDWSSSEESSVEEAGRRRY